MKTHTTHNIICLEAEWEYSVATNNTFSLNTRPLLNWIQESYDCDVVYRKIRTKADLKYYLDYFKSHEDEFSKYDIIYIACHGEKKALWIEGKAIPLTSLAKMAGKFFSNKVVHFSCCRTFSNKLESKKFKSDTNALLVSDYRKKVDAMDSSIADIAIINDLMSNDEEIDTDRYTEEESEFRETYFSLLKSLDYLAI